MSSKITTVLSTTKDWDPWISLIRSEASTYRIWEYINPDLKPEELKQLKEPFEPEPWEFHTRTRPATSTPSDSTSSIQDTSIPDSSVIRFKDLSAPEREDYKFEYHSYERKLKDYNKYQLALGNIQTFIRGSLDAEHSSIIQDAITPYEILCRLKDRFCLSQKARNNILRQEWSLLGKKYSESIVDNWLQLVLNTYEAGQRNNLPETHDENAINQFISWIEPKHKEFAIQWEMRYEEEPEKFTFRRLIQDFRTIHRNQVTRAALNQSNNKRNTHTTFSVTKDSNNSKPEPTLKDRTYQQKKSDKCHCGLHTRRKDCPYIFESKRPKDWKPDPAIQKKVTDEIAQYSTKKKAVLDEQIARDKQSIQKPEIATTYAIVTEETPSYNTPYEAYEYSAHTDRSNSALQHCFILDSGSTTHICNDITRFRDIRPYEGKNLLAGGVVVKVEFTGTVDIEVQCPTSETSTGVRTLHLINTLYIPSFHTNIVSLRILYQKGVERDMKNNELKVQDRTLCYTKEKQGQWILEDKSVIQPLVFAAYKSTDPKTLRGTAKQWHVRMGHLYPEAVKHQIRNTTGGVILDNNFDIACETCRVSTAHHIISRRKPTPATAPYERVHWDLIQMPINDKGEIYVSHFLDEYTRMNFIYILSRKDQDTLLSNFNEFEQFVRTQYNCEIKAFRHDDDRGLQLDYDSWVTKQGKRIERSPPYVKEPNGKIERVGKTLIEKARKMRIQANLPISLWGEIFMAAGYLLNRTVAKGLNWKAPIQFLNECLGKTDTELDISNLMSYGCRAYPYVHNQASLDKLEPRADIGYLVGFHASNIWRIWLPTKNKVIKARDVTFDESLYYDTAYDHLAIREPVLPAPQTIQITNFNPIEEDSDSEESVIEINTYGPEAEEPATTSNETTDTAEEEPVQLPSPEMTPEQEAEPVNQSVRNHKRPRGRPPGSKNKAKVQGNTPRWTKEVTEGKEIGLDLDEDNIRTDKRQRKPRQQAYATQLEEVEYTTAFFSAFAIGLKAQQKRIHRTDLPPPPKQWKDLQAHPHRLGFEIAAQKEFNALKDRGVFSSEPVEEARTKYAIPLMWVFTYKFDQNGILDKYKARLVVRGDMQKYSIYDDTYAATLAARVFRALIAIAAYFDLDMWQLDAVNAFLNSNLDEDIYVRSPPGMQLKQKVLKLVKALYGLKRSPLLWYNDFSKALEELGLVRVPESMCLYTNDKMILFFYVDDIVILTRKEDYPVYQEFRTELLKIYEMRDLGELKWFLGIRIVRDRELRKIWLCQDDYIEKLENKFKLQVSKRYATPMATEDLVPYEGKADPQDINLYQQKVGSVNFAAITTRPDIAFASGKLAQFMQNPGPLHSLAVDRILKYLAETKTYALEFNGDIMDVCFQASSDAAFADDIETRKSTEGYLFSLFNGSIDWKSTRQKTVKTSTTEAELQAITHAATQLLWWQRFFQSIQFNPDQSYDIKCDNLQTVRLLLKETPKLVTKLKHVDIHQHWVRQEIEEKKFSIEWIRTEEMPADGFTKPLSTQKHKAFLKMLGIVDIGQILALKA